jgi:hypothetical protein
LQIKYKKVAEIRMDSIHMAGTDVLNTPMLAA